MTLLSEIIGWKAWYGDGTILTSKTHKWVDIPVNNFQYLKIFRATGNDTMAGFELYCLATYNVEIETLIKQDPRNVKIGQALSKQDWAELMKKIEQDDERITEMV